MCECALLSLSTYLKIIPVGAILMCKWALLILSKCLRKIPIGAMVELGVCGIKHGVDF